MILPLVSRARALLATKEQWCVVFILNSLFIPKHNMNVKVVTLGLYTVEKNIYNIKIIIQLFNYNIKPTLGVCFFSFK